MSETQHHTVAHSPLAVGRYLKMVVTAVTVMLFGWSAYAVLHVNAPGHSATIAQLEAQQRIDIRQDSRLDAIERRLDFLVCDAKAEVAGSPRVACLDELTQRQ